MESGESSKTIKIGVEIKDPVAVRFYQSMPEGLRPVYAETVLTGAAHLASQIDFTKESIQVLKGAAKDAQENAAEELKAATEQFFRDAVPNIMKGWIEKLPNPKDFPNPEQYRQVLEISYQQSQKALETLREIVTEAATRKGIEIVVQGTPQKGRILEDDLCEALEEKYGSQYDIDDVREVAGSIPRCKLGDFVLRNRCYRIALDATEEKLTEREAREKVEKSMKNRDADGAVLVFRNSEQVPGNSMVKVGHNKFIAYFGDLGEGTWEVAVDYLIALIESQKRAEERTDSDITAQVAHFGERILEMIAEMDVVLEKDIQGKAVTIESRAGEISDAARKIRADKLSAVKAIAEMLKTIARGQSATVTEEIEVKQAAG